MSPSQSALRQAIPAAITGSDIFPKSPVRLEGRDRGQILGLGTRFAVLPVVNTRWPAAPRGLGPSHHASWWRCARGCVFLRCSSVRFFRHKSDTEERKLATNHQLTSVDLGSSTWARTRDLRINSPTTARAANPRGRRQLSCPPGDNYPGRWEAGEFH